MQSYRVPLLLTLLLTLSIVTAAFAEPSQGPRAALKAQVMAFTLGDTLYVEQRHAASCEGSTSDAGDALFHAPAVGCVAPSSPVVAEYAFPTEVLVVDGL